MELKQVYLGIDFIWKVMQFFHNKHFTWLLESPLYLWGKVSGMKKLESEKVLLFPRLDSQVAPSLSGLLYLC